MSPSGALPGPPEGGRGLRAGPSLPGPPGGSGSLRGHVRVNKDVDEHGRRWYGGRAEVRGDRVDERKAFREGASMARYLIRRDGVEAAEERGSMAEWVFSSRELCDAYDLGYRTEVAAYVPGTGADR